MPGMRGALRDRLTFLTNIPPPRAALTRTRGRFVPRPVEPGGSHSPASGAAHPRAVNRVDRDGAGRDGIGLAGIMARMRCAWCPCGPVSNAETFTHFELSRAG